MPVNKGASAPVFDLPHVTFTGLASPSTGAKETSVWRTSVKPGTKPDPHFFDHEEVLVLIAGKGYALLDGERHDVVAGDTIIVPAGCMFGLGNESDELFEAIVSLPVGTMATMASGESLVPPMAR